MRLILVHQYFHPDVSGSSIRLSELANELCALGFEITVYTAMLGNEIPRLEHSGNLTIRRLGKARRDKNSARGRMWNALSFFGSAFLTLMREDRNVILFIGSDPPFLPFLGWILHKLRGQKYVVQVADLYPEIAIALGYLKNSSLTSHVWKGLNRLAFLEAEKIVTLGNYMRSKVTSYAPPVLEAKTAIIENWEDGALIFPSREKREMLAKTVVLYAGNLGLAHDLTSVIEAARLIGQKSRDIAFLFIGEGGGKKQMTELVQKYALQNVLFRPHEARQDLTFSLASGDTVIVIVSMKPGTEGLCVPTKFYTALASGRPVLVIAPNRTEIAEKVVQLQCGIHVAPDQPEQIAEAVLFLHQNPARARELGEKARSAFDQFFTKEQAAKAYQELFESVS